MEAPHEEVVGGSYNELSHIVKGKRTKRLRPQSPIPFTITSHSSTRGDSHDQDGVVLHGEVTIINNNNNNDNNSSPPPTTSAENFPDVPTEEEEETAKCLILLSQGSHHQRLMESSPDNLFNLFNDDMGLSQSKFNSKKYVETTNVGNGGGKVGTYVYECKTCNRTFPSFQALGGHRASHKKPKPLTLEPKKPFFYFSDQDEPSPPTYKNNNNNVNNKLSPLSPLSFQFNNINMESPTNKSSPRIHTCSYCGAEFNSGQALGGHMRRHRGGANTNLCLSPLSTPAISIEDSSYNNLKKPRNLGLSLDLNLPAPEDQSQSRNLQHPPKFPVLALEQQDDQGEKQKQQQQQQQHEEQSTALVLSTTPQLIDCHY